MIKAGMRAANKSASVLCAATLCTYADGRISEWCARRDLAAAASDLPFITTQIAEEASIPRLSTLWLMMRQL